MSVNLRRAVVAATVLAALLFAGWQVLVKERVRRTGETALFELAPLDPRSLMQGDYMQLRYTVARDAAGSDMPPRGLLVYALDSGGIARLVRCQKARLPLARGERCLRYFSHAGRVSIGSGAFFFEEGQAEALADAEYGALKVDRNGNSVLIGLCDARKQLLGLRK